MTENWLFVILLSDKQFADELIRPIIVFIVGVCTRAEMFSDYGNPETVQVTKVPEAGLEPARP